MTGDIDDPNLEPLLVRPGKTQLCETKIDCDLSLLFLGQPIRVGSRECFYQGAFAVIDMPRGREDEVLFHAFLTPELAIPSERSSRRHPERSEGPLTGRLITHCTRAYSRLRLWGPSLRSE